MRLLNRLLAAVVAILVAGAGLLVAVEVVIAQLFKRDPWIIPYDQWLRSARRETWERSDAVLQLAVAFIVVGAILLLLQLLHRRPRNLPLYLTPEWEVAVQRRSLERSLARAAAKVDAVDAASVKLRGERLRVQAATKRRVFPNLELEVTQTVSEALQRFHPAKAPAVKVEVSSSRES
jgi:hypothetical protein